MGKRERGNETEGVVITVGWVLWYANICRLFNAKSIFMEIVLFQTILFSISTEFKCKYSLIVKNISISSYSVLSAVLIQLIQFSRSTDFVYKKLIVKTVLYQTIQFNVSLVWMSKTIPFQMI